MSKKRFVEFYLAACMKAATDGRVLRLAYTYTPAARGMKEQELVTVCFDNGSCVPVNVAGGGLLDITRNVLKVVV